jgi:hypothetical protein
MLPNSMTMWLDFLKIPVIIELIQLTRKERPSNECKGGTSYVDHSDAPGAMAPIDMGGMD